MTYAVAVPNQLLAIAQLRWRMFVNGLRSKRGKMELASRIIVTSPSPLAASAALPPPSDFPGISSRRGKPSFFRSCCGRSFFSGKSFR